VEEKEFIKKSRQYQKELKRFIRLNFGKKCGHIGRDEISLDCPICKAWLAYEFLSWLIDSIEDIKK